MLLADELLLLAAELALALQTLRRNETLDLGCLGVRLRTLLLRLNRATDHILTHIILLRQVEELANV